MAVAALGFALMLGVEAKSQTAIQLTPVLSGLSGPVDIASPKDGSGRLFFVEQRGRVRVARAGSLLTAPFLDISSRVSSGGERGLLGIAFPPDFRTKQYFYVNYTDTRGDTTISRFRVSSDPNLADPASEQILLTIPQPFANHNGGGLAFGPRDGYLYIGTGDGGSGNDPQNNGQRTDTLLGKMLRIDVESGTPPYAVPGTNPFISNSAYRPEIWATGLRNPWRYAFDSATGDLWIADVGQSRAEEVNYQAAGSRGGENYGWRVAEGLQCNIPSSCNLQEFTAPVLEYGRSLGCSITGGRVYRGTRWPALNGMFLYADYCSGNVWGVRRGASGAGVENVLLVNAPRLSITAFGEDESGEIYLVDQSSGNLFAVTAGSPSTTSQGVVNAASFTAGLVPGSLATVFGTGISAFEGNAEAAQFPLPTEINGTSVRINGTAVPLIAVARSGVSEQINFQAPFDLAPGSQASIVITNNGRSSAAVTVPVVAAQPELFALANNAAIVTRADGSLVTEARPIARGQAFTVWATGVGAVSNPPATGQPGRVDPLSRVSAGVEIRIGGASAAVSAAVLAPNYAGLYQINATVPEGTPRGPVDVVISTGGATSRAVRTWIE